VSGLRRAHCRPEGAYLPRSAAGDDARRHGFALIMWLVVCPAAHAAGVLAGAQRLSPFCHMRRAGLMSLSEEFPMNALPVPTKTPMALQWLEVLDANGDPVKRALLSGIDGHRNVIELESFARARWASKRMHSNDFAARG
jgi:hypothetical protein